MTEQNTLARSLHDVGLAAWFGGSLMGAVGLNGASQEVRDPRERMRVANAGWGRWQPVNAAFLLAHLLGGVQVTRGNLGRLAVQKGAPGVNAAKAGLTLAALLTTLWAGLLGRKVMRAEEQQPGDMPTADATTPSPQTDSDAASAQRRLSRLQWLVPALTGALLVLNARAGEQQRPSAVAGGLLRRITPGR